MRRSQGRNFANDAMRRGKTCKSVEEAGKKEDEAVVYKSKIEKQQVNPSSIVKERWHAVSIVGASDACPSATELRARRLLPQDAARLPMLTCAWPLKCRCVYRHYADRRATPRRASELGRPWRAVVPERRQVHGQRADD